MDLLIHVFAYCKEFPGQLGRACARLNCIQQKDRAVHMLFEPSQTDGAHKADGSQSKEDAGASPTRQRLVGSFKQQACTGQWQRTVSGLAAAAAAAAAAPPPPPPPRPASGAPPVRLLTDLPQPLVIDILSWCDHTHTVAALLATCRALRGLRRQPYAAARLLLRCPRYCKQPNSPLRVAATTSEWRPSCLPTAAAVVHLLQAGPEAGGPYTAPLVLMQDVLQCVAYHGDVALLLQLLSLNPAPAPGRAGPALLIMAIAAGDVRAVGMLLDAGVNAAAHSLVRMTPLRRAVIAGTPHGCLLLLLQHVPPQRLRWAHAYVSVYAAQQGNCVALRHVLPLPGCAPRGDLLQHAACYGRLEAVRLLLLLLLQQKHSEVSEGREALSKALRLACRYGHTPCVKLLLQSGAGTGDLGSAALDEVINGAHWGVAQLLMQHAR